MVLPDSENLFLLPFNETPSCTLRFALKRGGSHKGTKRKKPDIDNEVDTQEDHEGSMFYEACDLARTKDEKLANGTFKDHEKPSKTFRITAGQFVLLRPSEDTFRPAIGKVITFLEKPSEQSPYVRVQWVYRGEDLLGPPPEAVGEDEVFETSHMDDLDVEVIVGRCRITSYSDWLSATSQHLSELTEATPLATTDGHTSVLPQEDIRAEFDSDEDAQSSFAEHYSDASLRYYCRRFYDAACHAFANSQFECPGADPQAEIAQQRELEAQAAEDSDYEADERFSSGSEVEVDAMEIQNEELEGLKEAERPKARQKKTRTPGKRRPRTFKGQSAQFALPIQLGYRDVLPCRDEQKAQVRNFLLEMIGDPDGTKTHGSRCMYISGVPGTGKTATVREVLGELQRRRAAGEVGDFEVIEVNAMSLPDPALIYSELYAAVTGNRGIAPMHAAQLLEKRFSDFERENRSRSCGPKTTGIKSQENTRKGCVIVMLDEMDVLLSRKQKVLYDLLEWPSRKEARLAIIGIANTMDLPERMLPRLASRIGLNRLCYPPYTSAQITEILNLTLKKNDVSYDDGAIRLCSTKVGAVSGDVRRAFELCRRAAEIMAEGDNAGKGGKVTAAHIHKAIQDVAGNARLAALGQLSIFEKLVLVSSLYIARSEGSFNLESMCSMDAVCEKAHEFAMTHPDTFRDCQPSTFELQEACWRLAVQRLVLIEKAIVPRLSRVIVNLSADDCAFGLRDCSFSTSVLSGQLGVKSN